MKCFLGRYMEDGTPVMPIYDGESVRWFYVDITVENNQDGVPVVVRRKVRMGSPPDRKAIAVGGGWRVTGYWFNEDGSSPDPRPHKNVSAPWVSSGTHIEFVDPRTGLERTPEDLQRHIEAWVETHTDTIRKRVEALSMVGPRLCPERHACGDEASEMVEDPIECGEDILVRQ